MRRAALFAGIAILALVAGSARGWEEPPPLENEAIREMIAEAGEKKDYPEDHMVVVHHHTDVSVEPTGLSHVVTRKVVKVLDTQAIKDLSVLRFDYDPASQYLDVRWVKVFKKDGKILNLKLSKMKDLPQPWRRIRWGARMKLVGVPGLSPGDAVAWETYSKGFQIAYLAQEEGEEKYIPPMKGHFYDVILFEETAPLKERLYTLHMPDDKPVHAKVYNGEVQSEVRFDEDALHYEWSKRDVAARPDEKRQPGRNDFVTKVVLATVKDWAEKSVWFFNVNEPVFEFDEAIEKKVKKIIAGKKSDDEKVEALQRWVAHNIRYSGISMGKGEGYTIHPGIMTFNDRCGVCKDIAGMLITMMRAAGYTVYPAMTMAGARVEIVAADQFNHCVVAWKQPDGTFRMLDPTWSPFAVAEWSYAEGNQNYVVGSPEGEDLTKTPVFPAEKNRFIIKGKSKVDQDGGLRGSVSIQATGYPDTRMRRAFAYQAAGEGKALFHQFMTAISPFIRIKGFKATDHGDLDKPFMVKMSYEDPHYAAADKKRLSFVIPLGHFILNQERWSPYYLLGDWAKRKNPAMFWFPQQVDVTETVSIPAGLVTGSLPEPASYDGEWTSYDVKAELKGTSLQYAATWKVKDRLAPPEAFGDLEKLAKAIEEMGTAEVVLVGKGVKP
jgi:transglutaminase-like putative cysteine protease